jgi:hypothetical protein
MRSKIRNFLNKNITVYWQLIVDMGIDDQPTVTCTIDS